MSKMRHLCISPVAGYAGTPRSNGFDRKIWTIGESAIYFVFCFMGISVIETNIYDTFYYIEPVVGTQDWFYLSVCLSS